MIVHHFSKDNYVPYNRLDSVQNKIIIYDKILADCIDENRIKKDSFFYTCVSLALAEITMKFFSATYNEYGTLICLNENDGSIIIVGSHVRKEFSARSTKLNIENTKYFYEQDYLPSIYLKTYSRILYASKMYKNLEFMRLKPAWNQCIQKELCKKLIGGGDYGNVYACMIGTQMCAVKVSKLKEECLEDVPYSTNISSWHEVNILQNIFRELIETKKCPNLPYLIDSYYCKKCELNLKDEKVESPCVTTIVELASGNLKEWLNVNRKDEEIMSALFQILAGINAIQKYGQIMNFDVKKENILYYNIEAGGYWEYEIHNKKYKIPNYGYLFVVTDFGISRPMSPDYPYFKNRTDESFRLGHRLGFVEDGKFKLFSNIKTQPDQSYLFRNGKIESNITLTKEEFKTLGNPKYKKFYLNPEVVPPFEFYNDTQDVLRMFIGGKRTTQQGNHKKYKYLSSNIQDMLNKIKGKFKNLEDLKIKLRKVKIPAYNVLAGYLIDEIFSKYSFKYDSQHEKDKLIESYSN